MKRNLAFLVALTLYANEPSAFEAGDLNNPNPYGLTKNEKAILKNKRNISLLRDRFYALQTKVDDLSEKVAGLKSIVEGLDEQIQKLKEKNSNEELQKEIAALKADLNASVTVQKENFTQIKKILKELTSLIDHINSTYVTKEQFQEELKKIYASLKSTSLEKKSGRTLYKEAKRAYRNKEYEKAKELFALSAKKRYRPATSNFYIAESCYYSGEYDCAVAHYKKSASIYSKSSFMPILLLHTAISLQKLGKKQEAKKFFQTLIKLYPETKSAKIAKKYMSKV